jgi:hypothetical protein
MRASCHGGARPEQRDAYGARLRDRPGETMQRLADSVVEGTAHARKARSARVRVLLNYMQSQDRLGMEAAYNFYLGSVLPGLPFPKPEQVVDAQNTTPAESPKAAEVRIENIIDPSFILSSADRGLYKP